MATPAEVHDALINPQVGDHYWYDELQRMHVFVVKISPKLIWTLEGRITSSATSTFIKTCQVHQWTRTQFNARMRYGGKSDYTFRPSNDLSRKENLCWMLLAERTAKLGDRRDAQVEEFNALLDQAVKLGRPWQEHGKLW